MYTLYICTCTYIHGHICTYLHTTYIHNSYIQSYKNAHTYIYMNINTIV